jgi:Ca2+-binding EF-hand superfamily protein
MIKHQGYEATLEEVQQYISNISPDGSEWINFKEFTVIMA